MKIVMSLALMAMSIIPVSASETVVTDEVVQSDTKVQPLSTEEAAEVTQLAQALKFDHDQQVLVAKLVAAGACIAVVAYAVYTMYRANQFFNISIEAEANIQEMRAQFYPSDPHAQLAMAGQGPQLGFQDYSTAPPWNLHGQGQPYAPPHQAGHGHTGAGAYGNSGQYGQGTP